jgi:hypothetical protein
MEFASSLKRCAFSIAVVALAGCGLARSQSVTQNAIPQVPRAEQGRSWMLPEAKSDNLLYVSSLGEVYAYSYPKGKLVGAVFQGGSICPDNNGHVWVTTANTIVEYAHGGTTPIAILKVRKSEGGVGACAVDPTSGDLAVDGSAAKVFVFANAAGKPKMYRLKLDSATFCGYDNKGNLFVSGYGHNGSKTFGVVKLQKGTGKFRTISFEASGSFYGYEPEPVQWDGRYVAIGNPIAVARYDVRGFTAVAKDTTSFDELHQLGNFWIQGGKIVVVNLGGEGSIPPVQIDSYPAGGGPVQTVDVPNDSFGVTVSLAPHRSRPPDRTAPAHRHAVAPRSIAPIGTAAATASDSVINRHSWEPTPVGIKS